MIVDAFLVRRKEKWKAMDKWDNEAIILKTVVSNRKVEISELGKAKKASLKLGRPFPTESTPEVFLPFSSNNEEERGGRHEEGGKELIVQAIKDPKTMEKGPQGIVDSPIRPMSLMLADVVFDKVFACC